MLNNFADFYHNLDKKFKVVFWVVFMDFLILVVLGVLFFIYRLNNEPSNITITNWNEVVSSDIPSGFRDSTEKNLHHILTSYNHVSTENYVDAVIRTSSYSQNDNQNIRKVNFLVDIESLQQTYDINFTYNTTITKTDDFQISITCPLYSDIIYNNSCIISNDIYDSIKMYLPYTGTLPTSDQKVTIKKRFYDSFQKHAKEPYLAVSINSCDNPTIIKEGESFIKDWLKTRYLDPNDFYVEILNLCE